MKISKRSWHIRYLRFWGVEFEKLPKSLCGYFWTLCLHLTIVPAFMVMTSPIWIPIVALGAMLAWLEEKEAARKAKQELIPKSPRGPRTLLGAWLKAKKEKVCPIIEWSDE
jgi:hypothetical protein